MPGADRPGLRPDQATDADHLDRRRAHHRRRLHRHQHDALRLGGHRPHGDHRLLALLHQAARHREGDGPERLPERPRGPARLLLQHRQAGGRREERPPLLPRRRLDLPHPALRQLVRAVPLEQRPGAHRRPALRVQPPARDRRPPPPGGTRTRRERPAGRVGRRAQRALQRLLLRPHPLQAGLSGRGRRAHRRHPARRTERLRDRRARRLRGRPAARGAERGRPRTRHRGAHRARAGGGWLLRLRGDAAPLRGGGVEGGGQARRPLQPPHRRGRRRRARAVGLGDGQRRRQHRAGPGRRLHLRPLPRTGHRRPRRQLRGPPHLHRPGARERREPRAQRRRGGRAG